MLCVHIEYLQMFTFYYNLDDSMFLLIWLNKNGLFPFIHDYHPLLLCKFGQMKAGISTIFRIHMENQPFPLTSSLGLLDQSWTGMTEDGETPILDTVVLHACFCSSAQLQKSNRIALESLNWWLQTSFFPFLHLHGSLCKSSISPLICLSLVVN